MSDCIECGYALHSNREIEGYETCVECACVDCDYCSSEAAICEGKERYCEDCYKVRSLTGALRAYNASTNR